MKFLLTQQQLNNLSIFLQRVELKGSEVPAYNELVSVFSNPIIKEEPKTAEKPKKDAKK